MQVEFRNIPRFVTLLDCSAYGVAAPKRYDTLTVSHGDAFRRQRGEHRQASTLRDRRMRGDEVAEVNSVEALFVGVFSKRLQWLKMMNTKPNWFILARSA